MKDIENDETLILVLHSLGYLKIEDSFDYLIKMPMNSLTKKNVEKLKMEYAKLVEEIQNIENKQIQQMWLTDLYNI
jgi:DNA topoisomerase-2